MKIRFSFPFFLVLLLASQLIQAQTFVTNGSATSLGGGCYQLTPDQPGQAGSFFSTNPIDLTQEFAFDARFYFGDKDANGADGIVFIFATTNTALGVGGGGLGYQGITPSIAVEYDDYLNGWGDPAQDHAAIISNGVLDHTQPTNLTGPNNLPNIEDDEEHCFSFLWDPATQLFAASLDGELISYTGDIVNDIFGGNPIVYYGFSSGTGSLSNLHRVCFGPPILQPMEDVTVCQGESVELEADPNGIAWNWVAHPTLDPDDVYNPTATPTITTEYRVAIDYACDGFHQDTVRVTVIPEPNATANNNGPVCPGESVQLFATGGTQFDWDGPNNFSSSQQNPIINNVTINHAGTYIVTVTDAAGCTSTAETEVELHDLPDVEIDDVDGPLCIDGEPVQLNGIPGGGVWDGEVSPAGVFDPVDAQEGTHTISYTITDGNGCTNTAEIDIEVVPNTPAEISPLGPFCVTELVVTLIANPPGGTWGESADSDGQIYPGTLGIGSHLVTYDLTGQDECYNADVFVQIIDAPVVSIAPVVPLCADASPQFLSANPTGGTWSGATSNGFIDPAVLGAGIHQVIYTYTIAGGCEDSDTIDIVILPGAPQVQNVVFTCDGSNTSYTISFEITGGDPATYWVVGSTPGTLTPGTPATFITNAIPTETPYMFSISDDAGCDTVILNGTYSCACPTNAGSMPNELLLACEGGIIVASGPIGFSLDANDTIVYVLHTGDPLNALMTGSPNTFQFGTPLQTGVTYFIAAIVGNTITGVGVDLNDPCLSISNSTPAMWHPNPDGYLSAPAMICEGDSISLVFTIIGVGPFEATWSDGTNTFSAVPIISGHMVRLAPAVTTTYTLSLLLDINSPGCQRMIDTSVTVIVTDQLMTSRNIRICTGDSIFLENEFQTTPGAYFDTLTASLGCDSIVRTNLSFHTLSSATASATTCDPAMVGTFTDVFTDVNGCDSTIITTVIYSLVDTSIIQSFTCDVTQVGVIETLLSGADGCDSLVIDSIFLLPSDTTRISSGNCDPSAVGVFNTLLTNTAGCDSLIIETVSLLPSDATAINSFSCSPADVGVFTNTYQNVFGCDSIVTETVSLAPSYFIDEIGVSCSPADTGIFINTLLSVNGCDSIITTAISLLPSSSSTITDQSCFPSDTGTVVLTLTNALGCDSLVYIITSLLPDDTCIVEPIIREVYVPNVFSPNGDGINDNFFVFARPEMLSGIQFMRIYDRWGSLVTEQLDFQPNDAAFGWDGTLDGELMNPAVFTWQIHLTYSDGVEETLFGNVTLIR